MLIYKIYKIYKISRKVYFYYNSFHKISNKKLLNKRQASAVVTCAQQVLYP